MSAERDAGALDAVIRDDDDVAIAAVTVAELLLGVELASGRRRERRRSFVEDVLTSITVEEYDLRTARAHALLMAFVRRSGTPRGAHDLVMASTAISSGRTLLTLDGPGFRDLPGLDVRFLPARRDPSDGIGSSA